MKHCFVLNQHLYARNHDTDPANLLVELTVSLDRKHVPVLPTAVQKFLPTSIETKQTNKSSRGEMEGRFKTKQRNN